METNLLISSLIASGAIAIIFFVSFINILMINYRLKKANKLLQGIYQSCLNESNTTDDSPNLEVQETMKQIEELQRKLDSKKKPEPRFIR